MPRRKNAKRQPRKPIRKYQRKTRAKSRMPFVEQKQKDELLSSATMDTLLQPGGKVYVPKNFTQLTQGDTMDSMSGRWIYSKWISSKMTMSFDQMSGYNFPFNIRCRYGWIKLNLNPATGLSVSGAQPLALEVGDLENHVLDVLKATYNPSTLLPQKARDVLTLGDFTIKNNPRILEGASGDITTFRNDKHLTFKWSPQRKIQYQKCENSAGQQFFECNQKNWIPFVQFVHVPAGNEDPPRENELPRLAVGTRHYFTDA